MLTLLPKRSASPRLESFTQVPRRGVLRLVRPVGLSLSVDARWSLPYAAAQILWLVGWVPRRLDPPRDPRLGEGAQDGRRTLGSFARRLALPHDVEWDRPVAVLCDVRLDGSDILGRELSTSTSGVGEYWTFRTVSTRSSQKTAYRKFVTSR